MSSNHRVLHLIDRLDGYGASRALITLVTEGNNSEITPRVVAFSADERAVDEIRSAGVPWRVLNSRGRLDLIAVNRFARSLHRESYDLVHVWDALSGARARVALNRSQIPIVASCAAVPRDSLRGIDRVVVPHPALRAAIVARGVDAGLVAVIPLGAAKPQPDGMSRAEAFGRLGWSTGTKLIAAAGPLVRESRFDDAIWRYELVRVLHPNARLVIVGEGRDRHRLERYARLISEPDCVRVVDRGNLGNASLSHTDVYWQTSSGRATPHELLDAMHRGLAVVVADVPAHRAVISDEQNGFLAPAESRAEFARRTDELLTDATLRRRIGDAAREYAQVNHSATKTASDYQRIYDELLQPQIP